MIVYIQSLVDKYEIKSVEDPFDETDWNAWKTFTNKNKDLQMLRRNSSKKFGHNIC